jgi:hypothetical protein
MKPRNLILLLFIVTLLSACFNMTSRKKYSITGYFASYDSSINSKGNAGKKFKYYYEEYNADSNLIYQELYATPDDDFGDMWGKLLQKTKTSYNGKQKMNDEMEFGIAYPPSEIGRGKGKGTYSYEYNGQQLIKLLYSKKLIEEYTYDKNSNQIERRIINKFNIPEYYRFAYNNGVKISTRHFVADTIIGTDTLIYDQNLRLIEKLSHDDTGLITEHRVIERNIKEQAIEEKWRKFANREIIEDKFYNVNKYYYGNRGQRVKTEFYFDNKLRTIYEYKYD